MIPLQNPSVVTFPTSSHALTSNPNYVDVVQQWRAAAPQGEDREQAAHIILNAYQTNSVVLDLSRCTTLTTLPNLPSGVIRLNLTGCSHLTALPALPTTLLYLDLSDCSALATLPDLPATLTTLYLSGCTTLTTLPNLPAELRTLYLGGCRTLTILPDLPTRLTALELGGCSNLTTLPDLPTGVTRLSLSGCRALTILPNLPPGLRTLNLTDCPALTILPTLPSGLTLLNLTDCSAIIGLPNRPPHLRIVWYQPVLTPVNILTQWCLRAGKSAEYIANLNHEWQKLQGEDGFNPFEALIRRLSEPELLNSISPGAVIEVIETVMQSPDIRSLIFGASAGADANCHDRPLTIFNTLQGLARFATLQRENATPQAIPHLAIGIVKQTLLDEVTPLIMHKQWQEKRRTANVQGTGPNTREALEVQLALRHQLGATLGLPFPVNNPLYTSMAKLNDADRAFATQYVNDAVNHKERLTDALLAQPIWRLYLETTHAAEIAEITNTYSQRQETLEEKKSSHESFNDNNFLQEVNTLMTDYQKAIDVLFKQKTAALLE